MIPCLITISGTRGQHLSKFLLLPCLPPIGGYVCESPDALGLKVHTILVHPTGVVIKVKEEEDGDFNFDGLEQEGWSREVGR